ncbi:MAG TPA: hypothetical protein VHM25_15670, partial [Polyangiaceae bacterium]|nr:hypothetical protein [Polyangiaceae bacterium]
MVSAFRGFCAKAPAFEPALGAAITNALWSEKQTTNHTEHRKCTQMRVRKQLAIVIRDYFRNNRSLRDYQRARERESISVARRCADADSKNFNAYLRCFASRNLAETLIHPE